MSAGILTMQASSDQQRAGKRAREYEENEDQDENISAGGIEFTNNTLKRQRDNNYTAPAAHQPPQSLLCPNVVNNRIAEICAFYEGKVKELTEHNTKVSLQKDVSLAQMQSEFNAEMSRQQQLVSSLTDENKLLKKAVCIQEHKLRDANAQQDQLRSGLQQAAGRIEQLEATINMLRSVIYSSNSSTTMGDLGGFPPGPPDVY
jgi:hypothetical protein